MPPRNNPLRNAINLFHCDRCNIGFSRQTEYDTHLNSYGHTHTKRFADLKQITANEAENSRPKGALDVRANEPGTNKKPVLGSGFTSIGGPGSGFKKVGKVTKPGTDHKDKPTEDGEKPAEDATKPKESEKELVKDMSVNNPEQQEPKKDEDVVMGGCDGDDAPTTTWEEYDYTKPTGCDHANCPGCQAVEGEYEYDKDGWYVFPGRKE